MITKIWEWIDLPILQTFYTTASVQRVKGKGGSYFSARHVFCYDMLFMVQIPYQLGRCSQFTTGVILSYAVVWRKELGSKCFNSPIVIFKNVGIKQMCYEDDGGGYV